MILHAPPSGNSRVPNLISDEEKGKTKMKAISHFLQFVVLGSKTDIILIRQVSCLCLRHVRLKSKEVRRLPVDMLVYAMAHCCKGYVLNGLRNSLILKRSRETKVQTKSDGSDG